MKKEDLVLDPDFLSKLRCSLKYDPDSGIFIWLKSKTGVLKNTSAGSLNNKNVPIIMFEYRQWKSVELAYLLMVGSIPYRISYIDGDCSNLKWNNLISDGNKETLISSNTINKFIKRIGNHQKGSGCPECSVKSFNKVSKLETAWLNSLNLPDDKSHRQVLIKSVNNIKKRYIVDGFDPETNTVYLFHGDYWHGNPDKFDPNILNPTLNVYYKDLLKNTQLMENDLKYSGYKVVSIWENDWLNKKISTVHRYNKEIKFDYCTMYIKDGYTTIVLDSGEETSNWPVLDDPNYIEVAKQCGFGSSPEELFNYCIEHEFFHILIPQEFFNQQSYVVTRTAKKIKMSIAGANAEERLIFLYQRWFRDPKNNQDLDGNWFDIAEKAKQILYEKD